MSGGGSDHVLAALEEISRLLGIAARRVARRRSIFFILAADERIIRLGSREDILRARRRRELVRTAASDRRFSRPERARLEVLLEFAAHNQRREGLTKTWREIDADEG